MEKEVKKIITKCKIADWWEKNKEKIIVGGIFIGSSLLLLFTHYNGYKKGIMKGLSMKDDDDIDEFPYNRQAELIDEDIFTRIAPFIEETVLEEGLDEGYIDATYEVDHLKNGDESQGFYKKKKKVEVKITDVTEENE